MPFQCSSASRKFLNETIQPLLRYFNTGFSALQRAENSSIGVVERRRDDVHVFQCSSASRKFLNQEVAERSAVFRSVSVLFSEPKIPQSFVASLNSIRSLSFSALQRAENSSMNPGFSSPTITFSFSALQRAENSSIRKRRCRKRPVASFSALQRAENSSIPLFAEHPFAELSFQCSSASRKFLNRAGDPRQSHSRACFSALQRAENSSI